MARILCLFPFLYLRVLSGCEENPEGNVCDILEDAGVGSSRFMRRFSPQGGGELPAFAYGTANLNDVQTFVAAIKAGVRHIDTAVLYKNQEAIGEAIRQSGIQRSDLFLTTKVSAFSKGREREELRESLKELGVEKIDLCLLHMPFTGNWAEIIASYLPHRLGRALHLSWWPLGLLAGPIRWVTSALLAVAGPCAADAAAIRQSAWHELELAQKAGECRYIGVSNFDVMLLEELKVGADVLPAVNQIEFHLRWQPYNVVTYCQSHGIVVYGYGVKYSQMHEQAQKIAAVHGGEPTPAQLSLSWLLQKGLGAVARSSQPAHIAANLRSLHVSVNDDEVFALNSLGEGEPLYWDTSVVSSHIQNVTG